MHHPRTTVDPRLDLPVQLVKAQLATTGADVEVSAAYMPTPYATDCDCGCIRYADVLVEWEHWTTTREVTTRSRAVNRACLIGTVREAAGELFIPGSHASGIVSVDIAVLPAHVRVKAALRWLAGHRWALAA